MRLDGLIFDVDGTLADNLPQVFDAFRAGFNAGGAGHYSDEDIYSLFGPSPEEIFQRPMPGRWEHAVERYYQHYQASATRGVITVPTLTDVLEQLIETGLRLGIVSGGSERLVRVTLGTLGLHDRFGQVRANPVPALPKREHLSAIAGVWALPRHRLAYLGDSPNDVHHARDAGMVPLGAAWAREGRPSALRRAGAAAVFTHPSELAVWLHAEEQA